MSWTTLTLGILSVPLAVILLGAPIGVVAIVLSFAGGRGRHRSTATLVGRWLGAVGVALSAMMAVLIMAAA